MMPRRKKRPAADDHAYLDGLLSAFDDFPDGAWQAACESAIAVDPRFKDRDPYDVWIEWVESAAERSTRT